ncbi:MAG: sulfotransferase family 2 domain-containing protein [Cyanobacteriota bacterium]|nr:sulfotransferase family 2 domain-containing protein [Cyanobacteriota bacterium]
MISDRYKCIFIHIPKTTGSSIEDVIFPHPRSEEQFWGLPNKYQTGCLRHLMVKHIKLEVSSDIFKSYFKFTVIRNPWDKAVSQFCYTQQKRPDLLKLLNLSKSSSFQEYLHKISEKNHVQ